MNAADNKKLQWVAQCAMHTLVPPSRHNFANLRFIASGDETMEVLQEIDSSNYIVFHHEGGQMTLAINKMTAIQARPSQPSC
jgi:hypothetical protein